MCIRDRVYYGDETGRKLIVNGAEGDANLRSNMNWDDIKNNPETQKLLAHWQKLGPVSYTHLDVYKRQFGKLRRCSKYTKTRF